MTPTPGAVMRRLAIGSADARRQSARSKTAICSCRVPRGISIGSTMVKHRIVLDRRAGNLDVSPLTSDLEDQTESLQQSADRILDLQGRGDELGACADHRADRVGIHTLDQHLPVPADANHLCDPLRVVGVSFVNLERQRRLGMTGIDAEDWDSALRQLVKEPHRKHSGLEAIRIALGACLQTSCSISSGVDAQHPRQSVCPASSTTQALVSSSDTSRPTY
jgi:hypothetical protein